MSEIKDIPLQKGEVVRLVISRYKDGTISTQSKSDNKLDPAYVIGLLEIAKDEILGSIRKDDILESVEITLDDLDKEMGVFAEFEKQGFPTDKPVKVSKMAARMRDKRREEYLGQNSQKSG